MSQHTVIDRRPTWQKALPVLSGPRVILREPAHADLAPLCDVLALSDAPDLGLDGDPADDTLGAFLDKACADRERGIGFTYLITLTEGGHVVGACRVRALDPMFEGAEWTGALVPWVRGAGVFIEAARLIGTFLFETVGARRLESRVLLHDGRANGALRKLGAVQEGVLRRSVRRSDGCFDQVLWSLLSDDWMRPGPSAASPVH